MKFVLFAQKMDNPAYLAWTWALKKDDGIVVARSPVRYLTEDEARRAIRISRKGMQGARFAKVEKEN